jgi:hypothetical protein
VAVTSAAPTKAPAAKKPAPKVEPRPPKPVVAPQPQRLPLFVGTPSAGNVIQGAGGAPMAAPVQSAIESSYGVNLGSVRVHTDTQAQNKTRSLSARAFTFGNHIFLGHGERATDLPLMAHEAAHVVQQQAAPTVQKWSSNESSNAYEREAHNASAAVASGQSFAVKERTSKPAVQRWEIPGLGTVRNWFADAANNIPGFRMFTIVLGMNPINGSNVDSSPANILRAAVEIIPGGGLISRALDNYGIIDKVANWVVQQIKTLGMIGSAFKTALDDFLHGFSAADFIHPGNLWDRAKSIFTGPINHLLDFIKNLASDIIKFIKDAILKPLAGLASKTQGWDLLCAVLGENPITGDAVAPTAENLIGGFMKLIGQEEVWENARKANAISRLWTWFQGALKGVLNFVKAIPSKFIQALKDLTIEDIIVLPSAFIKVGKVFLGFVGDFISWGLEQVWKLLEIIFDVVSPGAFAYIKKTGAALKSILKNPLPFVGNLVKAAKLGFSNFSANFFTHLKAGLIDWLTGSLPGIYIPKGFSLVEIAKFVFSVLGLTWANIRQKLVKATSETVVKALETGFDIVVTLVTQGPAAAWDKIKDQLANLKDMVIGGITDFVVDMVVKKAIPKFIAMFIPGAGFISAILSIYDTIMVFVNKIKQIVAVVTGFIDSLVAIANGVIGAAAARVESALAGVLSLAINFLAGFAGLGKVADKIMGVINKIRAPIDKALDWLVNWIVTTAKKIGKFLTGGATNEPGSVKAAAQQAVKSRLGANATVAKAQSILPSVFQELQPKGLKSLTLGPPSSEGEVEVLAEASPKSRVAKLIHKRVTVAISARVQVKGEPVLTGILQGPQRMRTSSYGGETVFPGEAPIAFRPGYSQEQQQALGGTGRAATLPPVSQPPGTAARKGDQPSAGVIAEPQAGSREIEVLAWNTGQPNRAHNTSHAERQFVEWFEGRPLAWRKRVISVQVDVQGRPVCPLCLPDLERVRSSHSWITNFSWTGAPPPSPAPSASEGELLTVE